MKGPLIAITPGDPAGIGPEIVWKSIRTGFLRKKPGTFVCIGARKPFEKLGARIIPVQDNELHSIDPSKRAVYLVEAPIQAPTSKTHLEGFQAGWSIQKATELTLSGVTQALVTGPISKERLQLGGYSFSGHTDFLAELCKAGEVTMMLANDQLRVTLVTVHIGLHQVPKALTREKVRRAVDHTIVQLREWWGIARPHVAVAALNPHAGEAGLFGTEEIEIIEPELVSLRRKYREKCTLVGPLPADTLFAKNSTAKKSERYDAVVCMYHDQGLIPVKLVDFQRTVNVTLGLPIVRTSVDHGTAFDIAGKNKADPSSLQSAIDLALQIVKKRNLK